jgi:hypothetical protein
MRFGSKSQILAGVAKPSERIEDARPLLIRLRVREGERPVVLWIVDCCAKDGDKTVAVTIGQRLQHHRIDDRVYRRGRRDTDCKRSRR